MRILLLAWNFPPKTGGLENVVYNFYSRLRNKHTFFTVTIHNAKISESTEHIYRCWFSIFPLYMVYALIKGAWLIKKENIEVIFSASGVTASVAVILGKVFKKKVITHVFGLDVIYPAKIYQWSVRKFLVKSDAVISICNFTKDELIKRGMRPDAVSVIRPGIDEAFLKSEFLKTSLREKYGFFNRPVLLSVCRLAKRKGLAEFIGNSLVQIVKEVPDIIYLIAGDNPKDSLAHREDVAARIKEVVDKNGLERNVKFFGKVDELTLRELYCLSDIFILPVIATPGDVEGFGLTFIEANACGCPAIGTRTGGIPEAIEDGKSGIIVNPGDYAGFTKAVIRLVCDHSEYEQLSLYAQKRARAQFDWDNIILKYDDLIKKMG
ncbi:glycosyltransferase family 1 protein [bacterium]|nr:MAG: glycosyltransferase family 1 protein [bacterium]